MPTIGVKEKETPPPLSKTPSLLDGKSMFHDWKITALREEDPFLARNSCISREKHFHFSRETLPFLTRNTSISHEKCFLISREMLLGLARNASCTRRACQIGPAGILLASEPYVPTERSQLQNLSRQPFLGSSEFLA